MKKIQILIITLVSILTLTGITFAVLFFTTDTFKSDKDMFYTYISQINVGEIINQDSQKSYRERVKNESYTNEGTITLRLKEDGKTSIDENFNYSSHVDPVNKLANSTIDINKNGEKVLTVNYLRNEDLHGLLFKEIVAEYIVFENKDLKEFATKFGIEDTSFVPEKINVYEMMEDAGVEEQIDLEKFKTVYDKYFNLIIENIPEKCYSKTEDGGYKLTIDIETLQKVLIKVLETLKDDEETFDSINSLISTIDSSQKLEFEEYQETLEQAIEEISVEAEENYDIIHIIAYKQGDLYFKIGIDEEEGKSYTEAFIEKSEDEIVLKINSVEETGFSNSENNNIIITKKINTIENDKYSINIISKEDGTEALNVNLTVSRDGKLDSNNIKNTILATMIIPSDDMEMNIEYNNHKTFTSDLEIEKFGVNDHLVINSLEQKEIQNLATNLGNLITEKTDANIVEILGAAGIGFVSTSPVGTQETVLVGGVLVGTTISVTMNAALFETAQQSTQKGLEGMESQKIQTFNSTFVAYEGIRRGSEIKALYNTISASNAIDSEHTVVCSGITLETIESSKTYRVTTRKDSEGYVNQVVVIEQNEDYANAIEQEQEMAREMENMIENMVENN